LPRSATCAHAILEIIDALQADASGAIGHAVAEAYDRGQHAAVLELGAVATGPALAAAEALPTAPVVDRLARALVQETGATHARILRTGLDVYRQVVAEASAAPLLGAQTRGRRQSGRWQKFATAVSPASSTGPAGPGTSRRTPRWPPARQSAALPCRRTTTVSPRPASTW
jgi:hypothetical protein